MSALLQNLGRTISGIEQCFTQDKTIVLLLAVLLAVWMCKVKGITEQGNRMLVYTAVMSGILLCPFTAVCVVLYQSAFYDYEWAWSMVPVLVVVAYVCVLLYEEKWKKAGLWRKIPVLLVVVMLLFFGGNQGRMKLVEAKEADAREAANEIVVTLEKVGNPENMVLWGPKSIMQEVRRSTGELKLVYGRDMWDAKSGAYDYEAYSQELTQAFEWMELITILSMDYENPIGENLYELHEADENVEKIFSNMMLSGVNTIVLPQVGSAYYDERLSEEAEQAQLFVRKIYLEQYVIYLLE